MQTHNKFPSYTEKHIRLNIQLISSKCREDIFFFNTNFLVRSIYMLADNEEGKKNNIWLSSAGEWGKQFISKR